KQDGNLLALYQRMAKLRQRSLALRRGGCQALYAEGDVVVFVRPTSSDWHVSTVSWNNKPAINYRSDAVLYLDHSHEYRMVDVDK
ncbi:hypothetical protein MJL81_31085, partial [Salmonella enterica subsp. enterica serovar Anatum]|nr:hypothetical protein [Salmonella enterica subsp. enterica serovar Anatum]